MWSKNNISKARVIVTKLTLLIRVCKLKEMLSGKFLWTTFFRKTTCTNDGRVFGSVTMVTEKHHKCEFCRQLVKKSYLSSIVFFWTGIAADWELLIKWQLSPQYVIKESMENIKSADKSGLSIKSDNLLHSLQTPGALQCALPTVDYTLFFL